MSRTLNALAASALLTVGLAVLTPGSADADNPARAVSCYGQAVSYASGISNQWPSGAELAVTSSYCTDINVKPNATARVKACWWSDSSGGYTCNAYRTINAGTWGVAATNVLNNTHYYLQFAAASRGSVAD